MYMCNGGEPFKTSSRPIHRQYPAVTSPVIKLARHDTVPPKTSHAARIHPVTASGFGYIPSAVARILRGF